MAEEEIWDIIAEAFYSAGFYGMGYNVCRCGGATWDAEGNMCYSCDGED